MRRARSTCSSCAWLAWFALWILIPGSAQSTSEERVREPHITGFYMGAGYVSYHANVELSERSALGESGVTIDETTEGGEFHIGWGFGPSFLLEGRVMGSKLDAQIDGHRVFLVTSTIDILVPLGVATPVQPYVVSGLGGVAVGIEIRDGDAAFQGGIVGEVGGGALVKATSFLTASVDYRFSVLSLKREFVVGTEEDTPDDGVAVGGSGHLHGVTFRLTFDF